MRGLGLEGLKHGDYIDRLQYFYITRLKKFTLIRWVKEFLFRKPIEIVMLYIAGVVCLLILLVVWPFLYWKAKRDQEAYQIQYENRDTGWHSHP